MTVCVVYGLRYHRLAQFCFLDIEKCEMFFPAQTVVWVGGGGQGPIKKLAEILAAKMTNGKCQCDYGGDIWKLTAGNQSLSLSLAFESAIR